MSLDNVLPMSLERFVTYVPERFNLHLGRFSASNLLFNGREGASERGAVLPRFVGGGQRLTHSSHAARRVSRVLH